MGRAVKWIVLLTVAAVAGLSGCGSDKAIPTPPNVPDGRAAYVGAKTCIGCHTDTGDHWSETRHANALATLERAGQASNERCLPCHVVAFKQPSGFTTKAETPGLGGVQCENCHGPGGQHVSAPSAGNIRTEIGADVCGTCHQDSHHPTYDEWQKSGHAKSVSSSRNDRCIVCHSQEGFFYQLQAPSQPPAASRQKPVGKTNIVCSTCHDPHERTGNPAQMRLPVENLCKTCHRLGTASPLDPVPVTSQPRHGASLVFEGTGGLKPNGRVGGEPMVGPNSAHPRATGGSCASCHVYKENVPSPNTTNPNVTGHTFLPNLKACTQSGCHTPREAITEGANPVATFLVKRANDKVDAALAACLPYVTSGDPLWINRDNLTGPQLNDYDVALWNYRLIANNDPSRGVHNTKYAVAVLETALGVFESLSQP